MTELTQLSTHLPRVAPTSSVGEFPEHVLGASSLSQISAQVLQASSPNAWPTCLGEFHQNRLLHTMFCLHGAIPGARGRGTTFLVHALHDPCALAPPADTRSQNESRVCPLISTAKTILSFPARNSQTASSTMACKDSQWASDTHFPLQVLALPSVAGLLPCRSTPSLPGTPCHLLPVLNGLNVFQIRRPALRVPCPQNVVLGSFTKQTPPTAWNPILPGHYL